MSNERIPREITESQYAAGIRALMDELHEQAEEARSLKLADLTPAREGVPEVCYDYAARRGVLEVTELANGLNISARSDYQRKTERITGEDALSPAQAAEVEHHRQVERAKTRIIARLSAEEDHILPLSKMWEAINNQCRQQALISLYEDGVIGMVKAQGKYLVRLARNAPAPEAVPEDIDEPAGSPEVGPNPDIWAEDLYEQSADTTYDGTNRDGNLYTADPVILADRVDSEGNWQGGEPDSWSDPLD